MSLAPWIVCALIEWFDFFFLSGCVCVPNCVCASVGSTMHCVYLRAFLVVHCAGWASSLDCSARKLVVGGGCVSDALCCVVASFSCDCLFPLPSERARVGLHDSHIVSRFRDPGFGRCRRRLLFPPPFSPRCFYFYYFCGSWFFPPSSSAGPSGMPTEASRRARMSWSSRWSPSSPPS